MEAIVRQRGQTAITAFAHWFMKLSQSPVSEDHDPCNAEHFLRGAGVAIALPFLESPLRGRRRRPRRRIVAIDVGLGLHAPNIIPKQAGRDYELTTYLKLLADFRDQFTVISGVSRIRRSAAATHRTSPI